ncbi:hypothetical protein AMK59_5013 [Oryctes borbonicus]|uniref:Arrestin C-terminal-like domain-containing protein n=1 Tax=Oryctes borbonicus TaxID=1629725 RepID=A0A0T6B4B8_9SCAR|nr:hypothetical protein AMK59_5013 [Oryctes borbonicus]
MGLKECEIIFDNPYNTYYVGQTVNGKVEITLDSPKKIRGILIKFKGEATVQWVIEESKTNNEGKTENERIELIGEEEYFRIQYYCLGGKDNEATELPSGKHIYPFTCVLPPTLPSSFEGQYGHVRYTVKVVLDRPWKFDQETKAAFTVLSPFDLNMNPSLKDPVKITLEKFFCCCWCKSGPLTCVVSIPKSGYVPGEIVPVIAEVDNISNVEILNVNFQFQKVVSYYSQFPRRETKKDVIVLERIQVGPVAGHDSKTWNQPLQLPPLPPSNLMNCSIIDLDYELLIEVNVSGFHSNLTSKIPITVGTVAIISGPTAPPSGDNVVINMNMNGQDYNAPQMGWVGVPSQSKFSAESIYDKEDNQYTRFSSNNQQYTPMYPMYNFSNAVAQQN